MKPELSIILPSIRTERLEKLYDSILTSTSRTFELVIVGPYPLPEKLRDLKNVKYVKDFGSPVRASNIAASLCEGEEAAMLEALTGEPKSQLLCAKVKFIRGLPTIVFCLKTA